MTAVPLRTLELLIRPSGWTPTVPQVHWTVTLKAGTYRVFSDAHRTLARKISVS